jgi:hypothetical protein
MVGHTEYKGNIIRVCLGTYTASITVNGEWNKIVEVGRVKEALRAIKETIDDSIDESK